MNADQRKMVEENLPFAFSVAGRYAHRCHEAMEYEDIQQQALLGMCEAAERYDPDRGVKFISYAVWYIQDRIQKYMQSNYATVRAPGTRYGKRECTRCHEVCDQPGLTFTCPSCGQVNVRNPVSMVRDRVLDIESQHEPTDAQAERSSDAAYFEKLAAGLNEKQKAVVKMHIGEGVAFRDIGKQLDMSGQGAQYHLRRAMARLQKKVGHLKYETV